MRQALAAATPTRGSRSPNWGAPIIYGVLLLGAASHRGDWWGYLWQAIYGAFVLLGAYSTFHPKEIAAEAARDPAFKRRDHYLMMGVPYVLLPVIGWVLVIPLHWFPGILVPVFPWLILLAVGMVAIGIGKLRGKDPAA